MDVVTGVLAVPASVLSQRAQPTPLVVAIILAEMPVSSPPRRCSCFACLPPQALTAAHEQSDCAGLIGILLPAATVAATARADHTDAAEPSLRPKDGTQETKRSERDAPDVVQTAQTCAA